MPRSSVIFIPRRTGWIRAGQVAPFVALAGAFWPVLRWYGRRLVDGSDDPWGVAALALAGFFLWHQGRELPVYPRSGRVAALVVVAIYAVLYPWLPALVRGLMLVSCLVFMLGLWRRGLAIAALLALSLPVIASVQFYFGYPLRIIVAAGCEGLLELAGWEVVRNGTGLWWRGESVMVDAPCSGVRMLWTGLVAHFALCAWFRVSGGRLAIMSGAAFVLLMGANVLRATVLFFPEAGVVTWPESAHELTGLVAFALAVFLLVKLQALLPGGRVLVHHRYHACG